MLTRLPVLTAIRSYLRAETDVGRFVREHQPSQDLRAYAYCYSTMNDVWVNCERADWMLWMLHSIDLCPEKPLRRFAKDCTRQCRQLIKDPRSLAVVQALEDYLIGRIKWEHVAKTRQPAYDALDDASRSGDELAQAAAWTAPSAVKDDPFTAAYDTCLHSVKALRLSGKSEEDVSLQQADRLRNLFGNPFAAKRF